MRRHSFSKKVSRRRVDLRKAEDDTILRYEREDGTSVECIRPNGFNGQFSRGDIEDLETNGSHTDYIIYVDDEPVTVESSYEKAKDTTIDLLVSIDEHGIAATKKAVKPQKHVVRSTIEHDDG